MDNWVNQHSDLSVSRTLGMFFVNVPVVFVVILAQVQTTHLHIQATRVHIVPCFRKLDIILRIFHNTRFLLISTSWSSTLTNSCWPFESQPWYWSREALNLCQFSREIVNVHTTSLRATPRHTTSHHATSYMYCRTRNTFPWKSFWLYNSLTFWSPHSVAKYSKKRSPMLDYVNKSENITHYERSEAFRIVWTSESRRLECVLHWCTIDCHLMVFFYYEIPRLRPAWYQWRH